MDVVEVGEEERRRLVFLVLLNKKKKRYNYPFVTKRSELKNKSREKEKSYKGKIHK